LADAYGSDISRLEFLCRLAVKFHPVKEVWKRRLYMSASYRNALTRKLGKRLENVDRNTVFLQLGAYINTRQILGDKAIIASYQDGNVVQKFQSPFTNPILANDKKLFQEVFDYEKQVANDMDLIFTTSEYLRQSYIKDYGIKPEKVINIKIGINLTPFQDVLEMTKDYSQNEILFIGKSGFKLKGADIALNAFSLVKETYPNARLHMIGINKAEASQFDLEDVHCYGLLDKSIPEDLALFKNLLNKCSLFILPSRFEALGIAPLEAMAHRIPAIVTGEWALKENVIDEKTGLHCKYDDANDLAEKIEKMFADPEQMRVMGEQAYQWANSGFTWTDTVNEMENAINKLIANRKSTY